MSHPGIRALRWAQQDQGPEIARITKSIGLTEHAICLQGGDWQVNVMGDTTHQRDALVKAMTEAGYEDRCGGITCEGRPPDSRITQWEHRFRKSLGEPPADLAPVDLQEGHQGIVIWADGSFLWSLIISGPDEDGEYPVRTEHAEYSYFTRDGQPRFRGEIKPPEWRLIGFIPCGWDEAEHLLG